MVDKETNEKLDSVRGVTTVLKDIINKPDLMMWPLNEANKHLFGSRFDEVLLSYVYDPAMAFFKPDTGYTVAELDAALQASYKAHTKKSDRGKDIGHIVHTMIEDFLLDRKTDDSLFEGVSDEDRFVANKSYASFLRWWHSLDIKRVLATERPVYSRRFKYAGTFDLLVNINGKKYLLDYKTTNRSKKAPMGIYPEYFLQLGAYAYAYSEETGEKIDDVGIVNVGKDGSLNILTAKDLGLDVEYCSRSFAFAVRLHDMLDAITAGMVGRKGTSHLLTKPVKVMK